MSKIKQSIYSIYNLFLKNLIFIGYLKKYTLFVDFKKFLSHLFRLQWKIRSKNTMIGIYQFKKTKMVAIKARVVL